MVSKLIFDPQTLIDEEKENEEKKVKEVISAQEAYDLVLEECLRLISLKQWKKNTGKSKKLNLSSPLIF